MATRNDEAVTASSQAPTATERKAADSDKQAQEKAAAAEEKRAAKLEEPAEFDPATDMNASGAMIEDDAKAQVDYDHPAVDNNPRAGTTVRQNTIDFNDPTLSSAEAVATNLEATSPANTAGPDKA